MTYESGRVAVRQGLSRDGGYPLQVVTGVSQDGGHRGGANEDVDVVELEGVHVERVIGGERVGLGDEPVLQCERVSTIGGQPDVGARDASPGLGVSAVVGPADVEVLVGVQGVEV